MTIQIPNRLRFTNRAIEEICTLPPDQRSRRFWDTTVPDLTIKFSRAGTPSFVLRYTKLDGTDGDFSIGLTSRVALESARAKAKAALNDLQVHGIDPVEARRQLREEARTPKLTTFTEITEAFIQSKADARPGKPPLMEVFFLRAYVLPEIGSMKFEKITVQTLMDLLSRIRAGVAERKRRKGADGKNTANSCHRAIKRVFQWAVNAEIATKNPATFGCMFPLRRPKRTGRLDEGRFNLFWREIGVNYDGYQQKAGRLAVLLYMTTLQRPIDVARAKREHIDLAKRMWVIPEDYTKTGYTYYIPLTDMAVRLFTMAMALGTGPYVFPSVRAKSGHLNEAALTAAWIRARKRLVAKSALEEIDIELYDCRRFGRTQIRKKLGFSNEVGEAVINHVGEQHRMSQLYDVAEMLPDMIAAHGKWAAEIDVMTKGGVGEAFQALEDDQEG